ncbi:MAG: glycosyltransferase family 2 protein [Kiritimatiellia bacterium]|jgi:glycosyltransferase involved in cell wall biosynthesis|nr:glycosyltransferase family 2 protein [Kiritimatiellia bacterium]
MPPPAPASPKICILIPAYREEHCIAPVIHEVGDYCPQAEIVVIDDGSPDQTGPVAAAAGATVLAHVHNQGKGAALQTGFDHARETGCDLAITLDGDGQHAPSDIPAFLQAYERTHSAVLVGNRMGNLTDMPPLRRFVNRFMSDLLSRQMGQYVPDSQCGFRLYHRSAFPEGLYDTASRRFAAESEILLRLALRGFKIGAVTIQTIYGTEKSKIHPLADTVRFFRMLRRFKTIKKEFRAP